MFLTTWYFFRTALGQIPFARIGVVSAAAGRHGCGALQDKGVGADTGQVMGVKQSLDKEEDNLEDLSDNVATKDSGKADRHRLGEVDEISNNVTDFYVLSINPRRNLLQFHCYR